VTSLDFFALQDAFRAALGLSCRDYVALRLSWPRAMICLSDLSRLNLLGFTVGRIQS
jgi:hypothetical protein